MISLEGITDEQFSVIRPYNLSLGMDSISEVSEDDKNWEEVSRRGKSSNSESSRVSQLYLSNSDVESELKFWSTAVYGYVLGANPPFKVIDGFVKRVWGYTDYDQLSFNSNCTFLVRFKTEEMKLRVLQSGPIFIDNKPVIVKEWTPDCKMIKESVDMVPIWIRFYGLPLKFWGNALLKIAALVGKPDCMKNQLRKPAKKVWVPKKPGLSNQVPKVNNPAVDVPNVVAEPVVAPVAAAREDTGHLMTGPTRIFSGGFEGLVTPMPTVFNSFTPARIITKMTRQGGVSGSGNKTYMEVVEHSIHYMKVLGGEMAAPPVAIKNGVRTGSINKVHQGLGNNWKVVHNNNVHDGGRIWIIWDHAIFSVDILACEAQVIHSKVTSLQSGIVWWLSMVYGFNRVHERMPLWNSLSTMNALVNGPWVVMGDFNNVLALNERLGYEVTNYEIKDFQNCVADCGLVDVPAHGAYFTWNNKHDPGDMVFIRIDRVMSNDEWLLQFPDFSIMFHPAFFIIAPEVWDSEVEGYKMFQLVKKLKWLKLPLKRLNGSAFANIETSVQVAQMYMFSMQKKHHEDPLNLDVQAEEKAACASFKLLQEARRSFLSQKAKVQWMAGGDDNTTYFHSIIKARRLQNRILNIKDMNGN
ncbi:uncharacterized protein LOC141586691 [Silene latifolia]|uniref:uncharacterized protein LOC141586691 n=1 Tax=Silene latifolia TaxID=37657 RepID=UPI003D787BB7